MAEQFDLVTPDIGAADTGNPNGTFLNEDVGVPGTPILAGWKNTMKAFFEKAIRVTGKTYNGVADESNGICQTFESVMELITGEDPAVADWASGTFNQNDVVMHKGLQWFVGQATTINTPGINSQWCLTKTFREYMNEAVNLGPMIGGVIPLDDYRHADYAVYYREGKFEWYGDKYEAWSLHIDGSGHVSGTSDVAKLIAESKWGSLVTESDTGGTLTLKDFTGLSVRAVDALLSGNVGDRQESAMWAHHHRYHYNSFTTDVASGQITDNLSNAPNATTTDRVQDVISDGVNDLPNTANESRSANVAKGVWKLTIIAPEGTI